VRHTMLFRKFKIISINVIYFIHRCLKVLGQRVNNFFSNKGIETSRNNLPVTHDTFRRK